MDYEIANIIRDHIYEYKYRFGFLPVKLSIINNEIFVLINSLEVLDNNEYQEMIYNFNTEYFKRGYVNIYWGIDDFIDDDFSQLYEYSNFIIPMIKTSSANILNEFDLTKNLDNYLNIFDNCQNDIETTGKITTYLDYNKDKQPIKENVIKNKFVPNVNFTLAA
ncbi:MAG: hypothetical protein KBA61_00125 [Spirochaetes bacterium]|nr:hypothetical protein [Spirochaetota bacterium]